MTRPLYEIAYEIAADWKPVYFGAVPYLQAMHALRSIEEDYYDDTGLSIVLYFLANANTWRGPTARRIKNELRVMAHLPERK